MRNRIRDDDLDDWSDARARFPEARNAPPTDSAPAASPPWQLIAEIGNTARYSKGFSTISTGYAALDDAFNGGLRPESVYNLAGRTGNAKSTLALNIARRTAIDDHAVLFFKLEESPVEALWKIHAAASQVPLSVFLDGGGGGTEYAERITDGWNLIRDLPIRFSDERDLAAIQRISGAHAEQNGKLIIIDQLSMILGPGNMGSYERATYISNTLRLLAREIQLPIVVVVQVNRAASMKDSATAPLTVNDLRDSGALENDAAGVVFINRIRKPDGPQLGEPMRYIDVTIGKNRYGATIDEKNPIALQWWPRWCRIDDADYSTLGGGQ